MDFWASIYDNKISTLIIFLFYNLVSILLFILNLTTPKILHYPSLLLWFWSTCSMKNTLYITHYISEIWPHSLSFQWITLDTEGTVSLLVAASAFSIFLKIIYSAILLFHLYFLILPGMNLMFMWKIHTILNSFRPLPLQYF